jgi:hypothetical protein
MSGLKHNMRTFIFVLLVLTFGRVVDAQSPFDTPASAPLTVQAYVDGPSELHVTQEGVYWINGNNAKPGRLDGAKFPTYVDGEAWFPLWHNQRQDRGVDKSFLHVVNSSSLDFDFKLISVGYAKDDMGIVARTPVSFGMESSEYVVHIPDPQPGAMWYKFVLVPRKNSGN